METMKILLSAAVAFAVLLPGLSQPAAAQGAPGPASFKGETIGINVGYAAGGAPDLYFRILARHYGRHIPGNPTVITKNMPGAGTLRAANYVYNVAPKDGTELANFSSSAAMEPLMDNDQARFDASKFSWIGSMNQEINLCGIWQRPGSPTSFAEMLKAPETIFATAGGLTSFGYQHPIIFKNVLHAAVKIVTGYTGIPQAYIAMQQGEAQGLCGLVRTHIRTLWPKDVSEGRFKLVVQMGPKTTDELGPIPSIYDFVTSEEDRKILAFHFNTKLLGRPLAGPPGIPPERLAALRAAFDETMRDPEFLSEAQKVALDIDPATYQQVEQLLAQLTDYPKDLLEKAKAAITR
jgi:tripartite-type tricarboxylate transporter receptor subunit TctC